jgi:hypothetical protein
MRRLLIPTLAALLAAALTAGFAMANRHDGPRGGGDGRGDSRHQAYAIGLWGDVPYSDTQATVGVPNLIADMNSQSLAFTAHDGDLKSGSTTSASCSSTAPPRSDSTACARRSSRPRDASA